MANGKFIFKATLTIAFFILMSRILGLVRESVIAGLLGTSYLADAYQMSLKVPNMLFTVVCGALATVIVPIFTEYVSKGQKREAWGLFNTVIALVVVFFLFASIIGIIGAPLLVKFIAPGFTGATRDLTIELWRIILPWMIFASLASLYTQLLNANNIFGLPAFSSSVNNIFVIVSALTLGRLYGVHGLTLGTMLAMAAMALVQLPALYKAGFRLHWRLDLRHPGLRKIWHLAIPSFFSLSITQINVFVTFVLASWLAVGSVASLGYADKIVQFSIGLVVTALTTAVFPTISRLAAEKKMEDFAATLLGSLKIVFAGIIATTVGLITLGHPIVNFVYGFGLFGQESVEMTTTALISYSIGTVGFAAGLLLTRGFYSLQDTRTPLKISIVQVVVNLGFSLLLVGILQHAGLALASSLANLSYMGLLMWQLEKKIPGLYRDGLWRFMLAVLVAAGLMATVCYVTNEALMGLVQGKMGLVIQVALAGGAGLLVFVTAFFVMGVKEAHVLWQSFKKALAGRRG